MPAESCGLPQKLKLYCPFRQDGERVDPGRRLQSTLKLYKPYRFELTYVRRDDGNLLSASALAYMRSIETEIRSMEPFRQLCNTAEPRFKHHCEPGISMVNVMYPFPVSDGVGGDARLYFNGSGTASLLPVAVSLAQQEKFTEAVWPEGLANAEVKLVGSATCGDRVADCAKWKDQGHCLPGAAHEAFMQDFCKATCGICDTVPGEQDATDTDTEGPTEITALRSYFALQAYCCTASHFDLYPRGIVAGMDAIWNTFVGQLVDFLTEKNAKGGSIRVFFQGDGVSSYETFAAVGGDAMFAIMSYCFVLLYATLHTRSPFLALVGLFLVMLSIPATLAVFILASGSGEFSLMMCLSVFIVIGVGSDMLFVYTDFYKQSLLFTRDPAERLKFTYLQAASSTAATTFTTAMSFFANLASVLRPLREFGFFMGVCVTLAWLIVLLAYPAVLIMGERIQNCCRRCILQQPQAPSRRSMANAAKRKSLVMLADALDPEKKGVGAAHSSCLGDYLAVGLGKFKYPVVLLFVGITAVQAYLSITTMEQASGAPQTFPDDHNQDRNGSKIFEAHVWSNLHEAQEKYNGLFAQYDFTDYPKGAYADSTLKCSSLGWQTGVSSALAAYTTATHMAAAWAASPAERLMSEIIPNASSINLAAAGTTSSLLETLHWDTGDIDLRVMLQAPSATVVKGTGRTCLSQLLCYCGVQPCDGPPSGSPSAVGALQLDGVAEVPPGAFGFTRALASRRLQVTTTPEPVLPAELQTVDVLVVFGLAVTGTNPLLGVSKEQPYGFSSDFRLEDPWAQRRSLDLCTDPPEELKVVSMQCWLQGFKEWWVAGGEEWPVRPNKDFHAQAWWYANNKKTGPYETTRYVWFSEDQRLIAMYFQFYVNVNRLGGSSIGLDAMLTWDRHLAAFNSQAEASIKGAWHASRVWTITEAEKVILDSTLVTLCISLGCVFLGVLVFTRSTHLSLIVMLVVMMIVLGLLFFMVIIMSWKIGAIEVLSLIVFVGFAVDYCLHLSHKYHSCHITDVEEQEEEDEDEEEEQQPQTVATRLGNIGRRDA
ncbi:DISP3 [Symbiodinium natans]|uniref:DISP3 protein n=1 Tax=Symbiodinium natans TaxID=878477 RepID=A0A812PX02_9DINO|nr:DISP3 [Symbiodinium natans]